MDVQVLAHNLRRLREAAGYTKSELAARAGYSDSSFLTRYEQAAIPHPSADRLSRLATALDVSVDALLAPEPAPVETSLTLRWQQEVNDLRERVRRLEEAQASGAPPVPPVAPVDPDLLSRIGAWPVDDDEPVELDQEVAAGGRGGWIADDGPLPERAHRMRGSRLYAVRITGTCLGDYASPGDTAVFLPSDTANHDDLVVVADDDQALIKWLDTSHAVQYLLPLVGDPIPVRPGMRIVGVVDHIRRRPRRPRQ